MITGAWISQAVYAAAKLEIADLIKDDVKGINELALATNTHAPYLYRLLRALSSVGIFTEIEPQKFALTEIGEYLRSDFPSSLRSLSIMLGDEWNWQSWGDIVQIIKTGKPALQHLYHVDNAFEYFQQNPVSGKIFNEAMTNSSKGIHSAIVEVYDFSNIANIVDVAGGCGGLIASILAKNQHMQGTLFDLPSVVYSAKTLLEKEGVADRCLTIGGDFFQTVPANGDAYILSQILHDWDDERCIHILKNIRQSIASNGKLLVVEAVIPPGDEAHFGKLLDLEMLIMYSGGRERTEAEFSHLFEVAGFRLNRILPTTSYVSMIEGVCI
ncbi:MAG: methyltransferase [Calothrix sp. MO_192.B10]|nr:methyltransferase [Calothrix sp. MO_192.B10]